MSQESVDFVSRDGSGSLQPLFNVINDYQSTARSQSSNTVTVAFKQFSCNALSQRHLNNFLSDISDPHADHECCMRSVRKTNGALITCVALHEPMRFFFELLPLLLESRVGIHEMFLRYRIIVRAHFPYHDAKHNIHEGGRPMANSPYERKSYRNAGDAARNSTRDLTLSRTGRLSLAVGL